MNRNEPIFITNKETFLAKDQIIPYGGRVTPLSESWLQEVTLRLLEEKETVKERK